MARYSAMNLCYCTVFTLLASFASNTAGLSYLEELISLRIEQLEQKNVILTTKVARLEELELEVQRLQTVLVEQQREWLTSHHGAHSNLAENQMEQRNAIFRTCRELHQADPSLKSGMYWIDPDGHGLGDDPIYVDCDMTTGKTSVNHDSENPTNVGRCADPGCYSKLINYSASMRQMSALAELSYECHQSINYLCNFAPFEINNVAQSWWNDRNGVAQYFWSGRNNSIHTCQCGIDHKCFDLSNYCNCDSYVPIPLNDSGVITDKKYLPITRLNFGGTHLETSSGIYTLGKFECNGKVRINGIPKSCTDLWKIGHTLSGIYSVMGSDFVETVYCDFAQLPLEHGFQTLIGYSDVKSSPVYFFVQKNAPHAVTGRIPFEITRLNIGGAMNASSGVFTAPRNGIYSFAFSGIGRHPPSPDMSIIRVELVLNNNEIARTVTDSTDDDAYYSISLQSTLQLDVGDKVWLSIRSLHAHATLHDDPHSPLHTHFSGYLLQENVANSINRTSL